MYRKQTFTAILCAAVLLSAGTTFRLLAEGEEPDFSDTAYWNSKCTDSAGMSDSDAAQCKAYAEYMKQHNSDLQNKVEDIEKRKKEIAAELAASSQQIKALNAQVEGITGMIQDLNMQIQAGEEMVADLQQQIEQNEEALVVKQAEIDSLKVRVGTRMVEEQKTMHFMKFIDVLMGASSFDELIRIANGISDIYEYDNYYLGKLSDRVSELNAIQEQLIGDKQEAETMQEQLEFGRAQLDAQQASLLSARQQLEVTQQNFNSQLAAANMDQAEAEAAIAALTNEIGTIEETIANRPTPTPKPSAQPSAEPSSETPDPTAAPDPTSAPSPSAAPSPSPTPSSEPETSDTSQNPYYGGWSNCTWGCWQLVHDTLGISLPGWVMAGGWLNDAAASGYATGSTPKVYSIAVYSWHVAFVTAVDGDRVYIKEGNYLGRYGERWVPVDGLPYTGQKCLGYIYL